jgi:hypothetical protein
MPLGSGRKEKVVAVRFVDFIPCKLEFLNGGLAFAFLASSGVTFKYDANGQRTAEQDGSAYELILLGQNAERLRVKTPEAAPSIDAQTITEANKRGEPIKVEISGLRVKPYVRDGKLQISATAEKISIMNRSATTPPTVEIKN